MKSAQKSALRNARKQAPTLPADLAAALAEGSGADRAKCAARLAHWRAPIGRATSDRALLEIATAVAIEEWHAGGRDCALDPAVIVDILTARRAELRAGANRRRARTTDEAEETHGLVATRSPDGWALYPPVTVARELATGPAHPILTGPGIPTQDDYDAALAALAEV
jgi:hypothetical protein